jgi:ribonucleoside-diphosphate reductase beta chain
VVLESTGIGAARGLRSTLTTNMGIFDKRVAFKPFEYPEIVEYKDAINHSYWLVSEWNFLSDIHDFNVKLDDVERNASRTPCWRSRRSRCRQEVLDEARRPVPQGRVRAGRRDVRRERGPARRRLLAPAGSPGPERRLRPAAPEPVIQGRVDYLTKYLKGAADNSNENYTLTLTLFSIFIENVSLFSQFAIIKSFNKHMNVLKDIDNVVQATQKEEVIHALFGVYIIKHHPEGVPRLVQRRLLREALPAAARRPTRPSATSSTGSSRRATAVPARKTRQGVRQDRFNDSLEMIGRREGLRGGPEKLAEPLKWFNDEIYAEVNTDFFHKKPVTYSKKVQGNQAEDLF